VQVVKPVEATLGVAADHIVRVADGDDGDRGLGLKFFEGFIHGWFTKWMKITAL
jgi:hypothetical protein